MNFYWSEEVNNRLENIMVKASYEVYDMYIAYDVNMREAAYMVAIMRIAEALRVNGYEPVCFARGLYRL
jgi:glutamate dehydrogenase/leucine dehydrogenase